MNKEGKLIWITGLSGAGKTTIAKKVYEILKQQNPNNFVHLDGDDIRNMLGEFASFGIEGRKRTAEVYARLCNYLTGRGINVIISTISLYHSVHEYNRVNNKNYYEILLDVGQNVLTNRNKKGLYNPGAIDVMGINQEPEFPLNPDLVLENNSKSQLQGNIDKIIELID
jgi:adenylylsulfate kinase